MAPISAPVPSVSPPVMRSAEAARGPRADGTRKPSLCFFTGRSLMPGGFESPEKLFGFDLTGEAVYSQKFSREGIKVVFCAVHEFGLRFFGGVSRHIGVFKKPHGFAEKSHAVQKRNVLDLRFIAHAGIDEGAHGFRTLVKGLFAVLAPGGLKFRVGLFIHGRKCFADTFKKGKLLHPAAGKGVHGKNIFDDIAAF